MKTIEEWLRRPEAGGLILLLGVIGLLVLGARTPTGPAAVEEPAPLEAFVASTLQPSWQPSELATHRRETGNGTVIRANWTQGNTSFRAAARVTGGDATDWSLQIIEVGEQDDPAATMETATRDIAVRMADRYLDISPNFDCSGLRCTGSRVNGNETVYIFFSYTPPTSFDFLPGEHGVHSISTLEVCKRVPGSPEYRQPGCDML